MRQWLRVIAILEIIGGAVGLVFMAWWLASVNVDGPTALVALVVASIYLLTLVAGITLLLGKQFGRTASIIVQAIQLFKLVSPALIFSFSFGFDFYIYFVSGADLTFFGFQFYFLSNGQLFINMQDAPVGFGFSLTAILFLVSLVKGKEHLKKEEEVLLPPPPPTSWE